MTRAYMDPALRSHFVYRAYDVDGRLLYVGCTQDPTGRWRAHNRRPWGSVWAPYAVRFRVMGPCNYDTAQAAERKAQLTEDPWFGDTPAKVSQRNRRTNAMKRHTRRLMRETGQPWDAVIDEAHRLAEQEFPTPPGFDEYLATIEQREPVSA